MKEKNDKYIHCWLEGVEKAVIAAEIVNPNEIETLNEHPLTDEGKIFFKNIFVIWRSWSH